MPQVHVERSITVNASVKEIKKIVADFNYWPNWSPWLILEPDCKVQVSNNGKKQEWQGKRIGSGEMEVLEENDHIVRYKLLFLKPWKSKADVCFLLHRKSDDVCEVTWTMDSGLPFFMFWMKTMMERLVGMDYERGLLMLKDYAEKGKVDAQLDIRGEENYLGCSYVGIKNECKIEELGVVMSKDIDRLNEWGKENRDLLAMEFFSLYHQFDFRKNRVVYTSAMAVKSLPAGLPNGFISGKLPACRYMCVRHTGPYGLIGNAWSTIAVMERSGEVKRNRKIPMAEFYRNNPETTPQEELISDICLPLK